MPREASTSASVTARLFAVQTGIAIWCCLFGFLLQLYLELDASAMLPSTGGNKAFDVARFICAAFSAGLLGESIALGRYSESLSNLMVWYICLLFLLPYFHHLLPGDRVLGSVGILVFGHVCAMALVRTFMIDSTVLGRSFYVALAVPSLFISFDTLLINLKL